MTNMTARGRPSLTIVRRLHAPPTTVYAALTRPEMMAQWWGCEAAEVLRAEADVRPGGRFRLMFRTLGGVDCDCSGVYREVERNCRLVFTWRWTHTPDDETLVTMALRPIAQGTELTLTHAHFHDDATRSDHQSGWTGELHRLEHLVSARAQWVSLS